MIVTIVAFVGVVAIVMGRVVAIVGARPIMRVLLPVESRCGRIGRGAWIGYRDCEVGGVVVVGVVRVVTIKSCKK